MQNIREFIHQSNLIEGFDDPAIDEESYQAWKWLCTSGQKRKGVAKLYLTHDQIRQLQARLVAHQDGLSPWYRGVYRDRANLRVNIGLDEAMDPKKVGRAMELWLEKYNKSTPQTMQALPMHVEFEKIHPFGDGNGRTGRMLMWYQQKYLEDTPWTLIPIHRREAYYKWFTDENTDYSL